MPGMLYHVNATAICPHAGQVQEIPANTRVLVSGQPVVTVGGQPPGSGLPDDHARGHAAALPDRAVAGSGHARAGDGRAGRSQHQRQPVRGQPRAGTGLRDRNPNPRAGNLMNADFPFHSNSLGRTALSDGE